MRKKLIFRICCILTPILILLIGSLYNIKMIPSTVFLREGQTLKNSSIIQIVEKSFNDSSNVITEKVKLLGLISVKTIAVTTVPKTFVYLGGQPVGVKLNTRGVLVVALSDINLEKGKVLSPASEGGIQIGDTILSINNQTINKSEDVESIINEAEGKSVIVKIERKGVLLEKNIKPVKGNDSSLKIGLWIRDSTAGVGTLTFYDKTTRNFAALGHPITDVDTGTILTVSSGKIVTSSIVSVKRGMRGNPGELKGIFLDDEIVLGSIIKNTECGIFGKCDGLMNTAEVKLMEIALRSEIKVGPAKILTTIEGTVPKLYNIEIVKLLEQENPGAKSMVIKVTDPILLEKTGGIVQGMSGSPIIQNNKLVGAVTHVLINKPDTGYGIYIEWMLRESNSLEEEN